MNGLFKIIKCCRFALQDHLRLLAVICNPGMANRHWTEIADLFGDEFTIDIESSLSVMIDMKLNEKVFDFLKSFVHIF